MRCGGNAAGWFPRLLPGDKTRVVEIHNTRNPIFPEMNRPEPVPPNTDVGLKAALDNKADILLIMDSDADAFGMGNEQGQFVNQMQVFGLLGYYFLEIQKQRGPIVKTVSSTNMINQLAVIYGVPVYETEVGFNFVGPKMTQTDALLGGEESGGYAFRGHILERDGILTGLYILDLMAKTEKKPSELVHILFRRVGGPRYYDRFDSYFGENRQVLEERISKSNIKAFGDLKVLDCIKTDGCKFQLEDDSWILIRFSGNEPIVRLYCEAKHPTKVQAILRDGLEVLGLDVSLIR